VSMARERGSQGRIAKVILQNVPVIAAGQIVEMKDNKPVNVTTVTLALTAEQAERLALAQTEGRLMLATRSVRDDRVLQTIGITRATLLGHAPSTPEPGPASARVADGAPRPTPKAKTHTVSVLRAGKVTEYSFVHDGGESWVSVQR
ncbi:MAG: Flp pilus assembly protein CpaB, partial [Candidatus Methylomirabilia bacterium]